jgi:hypothetical protein
MHKKTILISGPCYSSGTGLQYEKTDNKLWVNQLASHFNLDVDNISHIGKGNKEIFLHTASSLINKKYNYAIVQWREIPCEHIHYGLEMYSTKSGLINDVHIVNDIHLVNGITLDASVMENARQYNMQYQKAHWGIKDLLYYVNILVNLAKQQNCKLLFTNYDMPWGSHRYFDKIQFDKPSDLDAFTQNMLDVSVRDDDEISILYDKVHADYSSIGSIHEDKWINLYDPMVRLKVDTASSDDSHPGYKSHDKFSDFFIKHLIDIF